MSDICKISKCGRKVARVGYCQRHYLQVRKDKPITDIHMYERHGMSKTSEYQSWKGMRERCYDKNNLKYSHYGGRGIAVCNA